MKTIRIYGDSYAVKERFGNPPVIVGWGQMLEELLSIPVKNNARSGSGTEYAIKSFMDDVQNNVIGEDDIIIYVPSSLGRLYFSYQLNELPESASFYRVAPEYIPKSHTWYWDNKDHIEWWMVNNDRYMQSITFESYVNLLKMFAMANPKCTVIVLPTQNNTDIVPDVSKNISINNFLKANIFLSEITAAEITNATVYDFYRWTKFTKVDPRANHLTQTNLKILANLLTESIKTLNIDNITFDKFQSNIINPVKSKEEYLKCINDGLLVYRNDIYQNLS
jgi:hypothetical protein